MLFIISTSSNAALRPAVISSPVSPIEGSGSVCDDNQISYYNKETRSTECLKSLDELCSFGSIWVGGKEAGSGECTPLCGPGYEPVLDKMSLIPECVSICKSGEIYSSAKNSCTPLASDSNTCSLDPSIKVTSCPSSNSASSPPPPPRPLPPLSTCRANNYSITGCDRFSQEQQQDLAAINAKRSELQSTCNSQIQSTQEFCAAKKVEANSAVQQALAQSQSSSSASGATCNASQAISSASSQVNQIISQCQAKIQGCHNTCNKSVTVFNGMPQASVSDSTCQSRSSTYLSPLSQQVSSLNSSKQQADANCEKLSAQSDSAPEAPSTTNRLAETTAATTSSSDGSLKSKITGIGGAIVSGLSGGLAKSSGELGGSRGSSYGSGGSGSFNAPSGIQGGSGSLGASQSASNYSLNETSGTRYNGGGTVGTQGLPDLPVSREDQIRNSNNNQNFQNNNYPNSPNSPRMGGMAGAPPSQSGSDNRDRGARNYANTQQRNLVGGYKNVKAGDGGGDLSIRPNDFRRYGSTVLKTKLNEARKKYGKDMPLIFRNGKFVLDFLAMKESEKFQNRKAAMENFWNGKEKRKPAYSQPSSSDSTLGSDKKPLVHLNSELNIWPLLNYRYRQALSDIYK